MPMKVILRGGPKDGLAFDLPDDDQREVRMPVLVEQPRALTPEEWDDPANWEFDEYEGRWVPKRPKFGEATYHRTDEIEDGQVVFR